MSFRIVHVTQRIVQYHVFNLVDWVPSIYHPELNWQEFSFQMFADFLHATYQSFQVGAENNLLAGWILTYAPFKTKAIIYLYGVFGVSLNPIGKCLWQKCVRWDKCNPNNVGDPFCLAESIYIFQVSFSPLLVLFVKNLWRDTWKRWVGEIRLFQHTDVVAFTVQPELRDGACLTCA